MKYTINLLPQKEAPLAEQLMYFSLNYLRYIIIITQLIVIGVFFYRFQIDQRIIDLKESVDQKKEIVQVVAPLLVEADTISKRTVKSESIIHEQNQFSQMINYFLSQFPASVTLSELKLENETLKIYGSVIDLRQLEAFYSLLRSDKKFSTVNLQDIKKTESGYIFTLELSKFKSN